LPELMFHDFHTALTHYPPARMDVDITIPHFIYPELDSVTEMAFMFALAGLPVDLGFRLTIRFRDERDARYVDASINVLGTSKIDRDRRVRIILQPDDRRVRVDHLDIGTDILSRCLAKLFCGASETSAPRCSPPSAKKP
jgi:hypothetical protein